MSDDEYNYLINGPLSHPLPIMRMSRLNLALRHVVERTGALGDEALREICRDYDDRDNNDSDGE